MFSVADDPLDRAARWAAPRHLNLRLAGVFYLISWVLGLSVHSQRVIGASRHRPATMEEPTVREIDATLAAFDNDPRFTGSGSVLHIAPQEDPQLQAYVVHFEARGRTAWHAHERGQLLICTAGRGYVATRDGTVIELRPGTAAWTDAGEQHWHGAGPGGPMTHIAVQIEASGGAGVDWREAVSDSEWAAILR